MMVTVTEAMNAMGQDWECSEVLRGEVRRLLAHITAQEQAIKIYVGAIRRVEEQTQYINKGSIIPVEETAAAWDRVDAFCQAIDDLCDVLTHPAAREGEMP